MPTSTASTWPSRGQTRGSRPSPSTAPGWPGSWPLLDSGGSPGLVVFKLDRLTRSLADWSRLIDRYFGRSPGARRCSASRTRSTPGRRPGRMVLNIMMTVAQWERETIVERTRGAMAFKRSRAERVSGRHPVRLDLAPDGRTLVPNPAELVALVEVRRWRSEGRSLRRIAADLQALGVPTKSGRPWSHSTVQALLDRPD